MSTSVTAVYLHVVDSVIGKLREEFLNEGVDDAVLTELQALWEMKMLQCGAIQGPIERSRIQKAAVPTPVHDLNVPYEAPEEYETPTAEMLFPPTPLQTPMQTPLPVDTPGYQYFSPGPNDYASTPTPDAGAGTVVDGKSSRPPYVQRASPWMNQRPLGVDVNIAYEEAREEDAITGSDLVEGVGASLTTAQPSSKEFLSTNAGKRKRDEHASHILPVGYIPQQDGSGDDQENESSCHEFRGIIASISVTKDRRKQSCLTIPQNDGFPDNYDEGGSNEDYGTPLYYASTPNTAGTSNVGTPKPTKSEAADDDEPPLNEDDDDDEDLDELEGDEVPATNHLVLAQFEKVTRTKSRWKCTLKDGIMHLNNKDILFTKANGEFEF